MTGQHDIKIVLEELQANLPNECINDLSDSKDCAVWLTFLGMCLVSCLVLVADSSGT